MFGAFGDDMTLAMALAPVLLGIGGPAVATEVNEPDVRCASTPYGDAWGRTSPSGTVQLCRVPATMAGEASQEYELRAGELLLWRMWLPRVLDEAVVSDGGVVDGFTIQEERGSDPIAHVVTVSARGVLEREWRIAARQKWFVCGGGVPPVTEIARVDASRIAVRTGYDDLLILDAEAATPSRTFDLHGLPCAQGEQSWIVEWDVLPGGEVAAVRVAYRRYEGGTARGPLGTRSEAREDFWMRVFVVTSDGTVLWSRSEHCLTVHSSSRHAPHEAAAARAFREERSQRIKVLSDSRFEVIVRPEATTQWIQVEKDPDGGWRADVLGG